MSLTSRIDTLLNGETGAANRLAAKAWETGGEFFSWWTDELLSCLPAKQQAILRPTQRQLLVAIEDDTLHIFRRSGGQLEISREISLGPDGASDDELSQVVQRAVAGDANITARVPDDRILTRRIHLPMAAAENLRDVLSFELDRHTPFAAEDVYFDYTVVERDLEAQTIGVDVAIVPRMVVDEIVDTLAPLGLPPKKVVAWDADGSKIRAVFAQPRSEGMGSTGRMTAALAGMVLILVVAVTYGPLTQKRATLAALETELAELQTKGRASQAMQAQLDAFRTKGVSLTRAKAAQPTVVETLFDVSQVLPDSAWVTQFKWDKGRISITGYSPNASELIELLEGSAHLSKVRFESPVTADARMNMDRFEISAQVGGT